MNAARPDLPERTRVALAAGEAAYRAVYDQHGERDRTTCRCGRGFNRAAGLGTHLAHVRRLAAAAQLEACRVAAAAYDAGER